MLDDDPYNKQLQQNHTSASGSTVSVTPFSVVPVAAVSVGGASVVASSDFVSAGGGASEVSTGAASLTSFSAVASVVACSLAAGVGIEGVRGAADWRSFSRFFSSVRK